MERPSGVCFVAEFDGQIVTLAHEPWDDCVHRCMSRTAETCRGQHSRITCCARCRRQLRKVAR